MTRIAGVLYGAALEAGGEALTVDQAKPELSMANEKSPLVAN